MSSDVCCDEGGVDCCSCFVLSCWGEACDDVGSSIVMADENLEAPLGCFACDVLGRRADCFSGPYAPDLYFDFKIL